MTRKSITALAALVCVAALAGCRMHVDKDANGKEKTVQLDTPFGGLHVNTDQTTASDLGLPVYPGAQPETDKDNNKSADVHMGFGEWQLRVRVVQYSSADPQDKVVAYYKKALGRYGDVITCQGNASIGTPTVTSQGLNCTDGDKNGNIHINSDKNGVGLHDGLELKAGSKRHQHIVGFQYPKDNRVRFALIALDLPSGVTSDDDKRD